MYINSRYALAFAKYEHDASLLLDGWVYDRYKTVFSDLTVGSLQKGKLNRRASKYLQVNLEHSDTDLIRQYRNKVAHLNAMFDLMSKVYVDATMQGKKGMNEHSALVSMIDRSYIPGKVIVLMDTQKGRCKPNLEQHLSEYDLPLHPTHRGIRI